MIDCKIDWLIEHSHALVEECWLERMNAWTKNERTNEYVNGWMDELMNEQRKDWKKECKNERRSN